jgi:hypothetical protein
MGHVWEEQMINAFCSGEKIKVDSSPEYNLVLTCDLKALMKMKGLYKYYSENAQLCLTMLPHCAKYSPVAGGLLGGLTGKE